MKIATRGAAALLLVASVFAGSPAAVAIQERKPAPQGQDKSQSQDRRFKWWQDDKFRKELGLSADQAAKINGIWESTVPEIRKIDQELDALSKELSRLIEDKTAAESVVQRQIHRVETRRAEIETARRFMIYKMHRVLSPEQNTKFKQLWAARTRRDHSPRQR